MVQKMKNTHTYTENCHDRFIFGLGDETLAHCENYNTFFWEMRFSIFHNRIKFFSTDVSKKILCKPFYSNRKLTESYFCLPESYEGEEVKVGV